MENDCKFSCKTRLKATNIINIYLQHFKKLIIQQSIQLAIQYFSPLTLSVHKQFSFKRLWYQSFRAEREEAGRAEQIPALREAARRAPRRAQRSHGGAGPAAPSAYPFPGHSHNYTWSRGPETRRSPPSPLLGCFLPLYSLPFPLAFGVDECHGNRNTRKIRQRNTSTPFTQVHQLLTFCHVDFLCVYTYFCKLFFDWTI